MILLREKDSFKMEELILLDHLILKSMKEN